MTVHGTLGDITFFYTEDEVVTTTRDGERRETFGRTDLLENLLAAAADRDSAAVFPGGYRRVHVGTRSHPDGPEPQEIGAGHRHLGGRRRRRAPRRPRHLPELMDRAAKAQATFAELGVPWARSLPASRQLRPGRSSRGRLPGRQPHPRRFLAAALPSPRPHAGRNRRHGSPAAGPRVAPRCRAWPCRMWTASTSGAAALTPATAGEYVWRTDHGSIVRLGRTDARGTVPGGNTVAGTVPTALPS